MLSDDCMQKAGSLEIQYITDHLEALIAFVVSLDNSCRYCIASTRSRMLDIGYPETRIQELAIDFHAPSLPEPEQEALKFARRLSRANPRPTNADLENLRDQGFSREEITELGAVAATTLINNRIGTIRNLDPPEEPTDSNRLAGMVFRFWNQTQKLWNDWWKTSESYKPGDYDGPGMNLLKSLPPVPCLNQLEALLELIWKSSLIERSTRAMMLGVIGRLVNCTVSQQITRRTLKQEGYSEEEIEDLLDRLDSPRLDEVERKLLSICRASVWMQEPEPVVRQFRELEQEAGPEVADEALVFLSVANCMCRFTVLEGLAERSVH